MRISVIIPFCNNRGSIQELFQRLLSVAENDIFNTHEIELVLVDDGSTDDTYKTLQLTKKNFPSLQCRLIKLTRNYGSYNSFLAGVQYAESDCCVYLHADLQDPPELIPELFGHYLRGNKLVIANRSDREDANIFSSIYHFLVRKFAIPNAPPGGFDLMLFDRQIRDQLLTISEKNTNYVYLINWLGYPYVTVPYKREKRKYGKSQWSFLKKVKLFVDTFFSFSKLPIFLFRLGLLFSLAFFVVAIVLLFLIPSPMLKIICGLAFLMSFFSFYVLILAEYMDRIHETVRGRPNFVVESNITADRNSEKS